MTNKEALKKLIQTASGKEPADLIIKNCQIVDVFNRDIFQGNVAVKGSQIAGFVSEDVTCPRIIDAKGSYLVPGLINGHVHVESSHCTPREYARMVVPCGTTTSIADPHEICNVCGLRGLDYMLDASEDIGMSIFFMIPSCVPATDFEHAGATLMAEDIRKRIDHPRVLGLGELMNVAGVCSCDDNIMDKILVCNEAGKHIDGHSPAIKPNEIDAYCGASIMTDHESETGEELVEKVRRGTYVMLRQGSSCKNLLALVKGLTPYNMERCLFCTDDRHPSSILAEGDIDNNVRMAIDAGIDPLDAIRMATINAANCHRLYDRGAIAPGYRADFLLVDDLRAFRPRMVFSGGHLAAEEGNFKYHRPLENTYGFVGSHMNIASLSEESFALPLKDTHIRCIDVIPGGVVTGEYFASVELDEKGNMLCDREQDICKIAVIERHHNTGHMAVVPIHNYGIRNGAVATTIAHDSHNLIVIGDNDRDMFLVAKAVRDAGGGVGIVKDGNVVEVLPHPIAGLMSDEPGESIAKKLDLIHDVAINELHINPGIDPLMTLSFMALPVIPQLKVTDSGLFDYLKFSFVPIEVNIKEQ